MSNEDAVPITIEFRSVSLESFTIQALTTCSGGLEILFGNQKKYSLSISTKNESGAPANVAYLVRHLCDKVMKDPRKELFVLDDTV
jgi:ubiquitin related modifier 1